MVERVERRLAAILASDVVGYSRLMGKDETGTRARFNAHLQELIEPAIANHRGRIVKTTGDGLLVEFASAVEAVQCAVEIQEGMAERNSIDPEDRRMDFRIGVNLGDVIIEGDDIHGDGVNVAARLEALGDPGGVCVSGDVYRQCRGKLDFGFDDLGEQEVKNISEPVRAYRVLPEGQQVSATTKKKAPSRWRIPAIAATVLVLIAAVGVTWWRPWTPDAGQSSLFQKSFPIPDKPSIAILPFSNLSDDPRQEYFAEGIAVDINTGLSKVSALSVVASNAAFQFKGRTVDVRQIGQQLGANYILQGAVRRADDRVRINAQLFEAQTGRQLWAERYQGRLKDTFALQDKVTARIIEALSVKLGRDEKLQLADHGTNNFEAHDALLKGLSYARQFTPEGTAQAIRMFELALKLDPKYSRAREAINQIRFIHDNSGLQ